MLKIEEMKRILKESLPLKRYKHSLAVYDTAIELASAHKLNVEKVAVSALLHDCGREVAGRDSLAKAAELGIAVDETEANQPILLHAKLGVYYAQHKYGVEDPEILEGILYHTTGAKDMTPLAMAVYLADLLEPTRDFPGIDEMRRLAKQDMERAMMRAYAQTIRYLLEYDLLVHPNCIYGYNQLAAKYKNKK